MVRKYALFLIGLFIASMGVAFSAKAGLGTSPVASVPYSVSLVSSLLSFGGWLNLLSVIQIITQIVILRGKCIWVEIAVQTVLAFVYGYLTDFSCRLISGITVTGYPVQFVKVTGNKYENVKIFFDILYIVAAAVICLLFLGELKGVREGSIIAALAVGSMIKLFNRLYGRIAHVVKSGG